MIQYETNIDKFIFIPKFVHKKISSRNQDFSFLFFTWKIIIITSNIFLNQLYYIFQY